jgi:hypothetical protein
VVPDFFYAQKQQVVSFDEKTSLRAVYHRGQIIHLSTKKAIFRYLFSCKNQVWHLILPKNQKRQKLVLRGG